LPPRDHLWSNPYQPHTKLRWDKVTYVYAEGEALESCTTLPLFLKVFKPEAVLILVCDTLACHNDLREGAGYPSSVEAVRRKYEGFIDQVLNDTELTEFKDRVKVSVIPCFGNFRNGEFWTSPTDTRLWMLYELLEFLLENVVLKDPAGTEVKEVAVALDLTHGINYLPTLTYASLRALLHHIAFGNKRLTLRVYNSNPFTPGVTTELHINLIEETPISPLIEHHDLSEGNIKLGFRTYSGKA